MCIRDSSSTFWTKVTISLLEVVQGLLQPLHTYLGLQIDLRFLKMAPMISPDPKNIGFDTKIIFLARSEPKLKFHLMRGPPTANSP